MITVRGPREGEEVNW